MQCHLASSDLLGPDAQVEIEASLQEEVLHVVRADGEVEIQGVSQELVVPLSARHGPEKQSESGPTGRRLIEGLYNGSLPITVFKCSVYC